MGPWVHGIWKKKERKKEMDLNEDPRRWMRCTYAYIGGRGERRLERLCVTLGARRDAMTYRPRSPRALTSRSRPESDWEHVNSTPAITRSRPDRPATIGPPSTSPSTRLVAPARRAWSRTAVRAAGRRVPEPAPTWESFIAPRDARPLRTTGGPVRSIFAKEGSALHISSFLFFFSCDFSSGVSWLFSFFFFFSSLFFSGHPRLLLARTWTQINLSRRRPRPSWNT